MPVTAATAEEIFVGAGDVWVDGGPVGATQDDNVWRLVREYFVPSFNGVKGPLKGTDYVTSEVAEIEATVVEVSASRLPLTIPGATSTTLGTAVVAGGADTTLAEAAVAGQYLALKVTAITGMAVGDWVRLGSVGAYQYAKITRVGTALAAGTGIDLDRPLIANLASGATVTEVEGNGETIITPGLERRLPSSSYHDWSVRVPGLDGRAAWFEADDAIATESPEFSASDDDVMAPRITVQSRWDPATAATPPHRIRRIPNPNAA